MCEKSRLGGGLGAALGGLFGHTPATALSFVKSCPGGVVPPGASAALAAQCKSALITATRQGILVTALFYAWGSLHYFLASMGLAKHLAKVAAARKAREA